MDDEQSNPSCCKAKNTLKYAHGNQAKKKSVFKTNFVFFLPSQNVDWTAIAIMPYVQHLMPSLFSN